MASTQSLSRRARHPRKRRAFVLAALGALAALAACGGDGAPAAEPSLPSACTPVRSPQVLAGTHIPDGQEGTYNTVPASSGPHYAQPVRAGVYAAPIPDERQVHNLEHGHVVVQYRDLTDEQVAELEAAVQADPRMVLMAPYPDMDPVLALTAWGKIQTCDAWVPGIVPVARSFIRARRDHAPESLP